jgi:DNA mismatch repair ATPase MutS
MYGLLKPEVKPEDVFDFLDDDLTKIELKKNSKRKESEERSIVKYKKAIDEEISNLTVTAARQRMDILNSITADKFMIQTLMVQMQLQQLYQGAVLYHTLKKNNYPVTFPTIEDTPGLMDLKKAMPTRLVLSNLSCSDSRYDCCPNDFYFRPEDQIIQIEGPNKRGKSEAWRTLHLTNLLINAGYPISAEYGRLGVNPESHFISCKGDSGNGGSELERSKEGIFAALVYVNKNDLVILDELGDSTNKFTAQEIGNRILPPLKEKNCKILITSHHDALTAEISKQFGGISLMPDSHGKDNGIYRLVPTAPNIDYKAGDVLDEIGFTESKIRSTISSSGRKNEITTGIDNGIDEDLPF